jgi:ABC-type antimicrobial peptide transport system permease subunit
LLEAVALTSVGGVIGIALGVMLSVGVATLVPQLPARVSPLWVAAAAMLSVAVGLFFGIYPAVKAASLEPVRCLRYE